MEENNTGEFAIELSDTSKTGKATKWEDWRHMIEADRSAVGW